MLEYLSPSKAFRSKISCCAIARLKKPPSGGSNSGAASASPPSRFERLTSLKPPALPGDICFEAERAITLLQERRSALISAAVTGKIDVRGLVPDRVEAA